MQQEQKIKFSKRDGDRLEFPPKNKNLIKEVTFFLYCFT